ISFMADQNKVEVRFKVNQQFLFWSDIRRVEIIINNLVCNGIKFCDANAEKPFVEVLVEVDGEFALFSVEDNGRGIPDDHLPKIFDMFFRGDEHSSGSGIGLYIVKEITDKLNGSIKVDSSVGKGTIFKIILPNQFPGDN
ncbi:MAG TPA: HAMP domain-containing sensor histidine kinase, partial [Bacteroidales bacterium]|nr:HAMP domain-containing sensor histidine kinase [Bacteroidales bacterium]